MDDTKKQELFPYFAYIYSQQMDPEKYGNTSSIEEWTSLIQSNEDDINAISAAADNLSDDDWNKLDEQYTAQTQQATAQFAAKGAKLKKLKAKPKSKKCACGCDILSRKVGGKMEERCACNCGGGKVKKKVAKKENGGLVLKAKDGAQAPQGFIDRSNAESQRLRAEHRPLIERMFTPSIVAATPQHQNHIPQGPSKPNVQVARQFDSVAPFNPYKPPMAVTGVRSPMRPTTVNNVTLPDTVVTAKGTARPGASTAPTFGPGVQRPAPQAPQAPTQKSNSAPTSTKTAPTSKPVIKSTTKPGQSTQPTQSTPSNKTVPNRVASTTSTTSTSNKTTPVVNKPTTKTVAPKATTNTKPVVNRIAVDAKLKQDQQTLNNLGYNTGKTDGIYGKNTKAGIIAFQQAHGLTADGIIGAQTRQAMLTNNAQANPATALVAPPISRMVTYNDTRPINPNVLMSTPRINTPQVQIPNVLANQLNTWPQEFKCGGKVKAKMKKKQSGGDINKPNPSVDKCGGKVKNRLKK
jgi:hypothetical protein